MRKSPGSVLLCTPAGGTSSIYALSVTDNVGVNSCKVFYKVPGSGSYASADMTHSVLNVANLNSREYKIPGSVLNQSGTLSYYTETRDAAGNLTRIPASGDKNKTINQPMRVFVRSSGGGFLPGVTIKGAEQVLGTTGWQFDFWSGPYLPIPNGVPFGTVVSAVMPEVGQGQAEVGAEPDITIVLNRTSGPVIGDNIVSSPGPGSAVNPGMVLPISFAAFDIRGLNVNSARLSYWIGTGSKSDATAQMLPFWDASILWFPARITALFAGTIQVPDNAEGQILYVQAIMRRTVAVWHRRVWLRGGRARTTETMCLAATRAFSRAASASELAKWVQHSSLPEPAVTSRRLHHPH